MIVNIEKIKSRILATTATNRNPLYESHIYWSQKPYNICDILIEELSGVGDVIFDPFLGSGVTLLESIKKVYNRKGIGCEINEAPLFIIKTLLKTYNINKYKKVSELFKKRINELLPYYYTTCPQCGNQAIITSVIFDKPTRDADINIKVVNYRCVCTAKGNKPASKEDYHRINIECEPKYIDNKSKLIPNTKIAVYEDQTISQIFTGRNFTVLDQVLEIINEMGDYKDIFEYILMSILHLCKITDKHSNSQWPLWIPKTDCVEKNIIDLLDKKIKHFYSTIKYITENYDELKDFKLLHKGSQYISNEDIEDDSVSLIITDPPYLGQIAYSEYMQLYKPFFGFNLNLEDEIIESSTKIRKRTQDDYFKELEKVFYISANKIRNGGYLCMYFHDSNLDVWDKLISILHNNGFRYLSQVHIKKSNTLKNIISPKKSLNGDALLFFIKEEALFKPAEALEPINEIEANLVIHIKQIVRKYGPLSTPELYDGGLMELLIYNNWLMPLSKKYKTLVDIFEKYLRWNPKICKWEL
jgi:DNA modification methylase